MRSSANPRKTGFTLIELSIVLVIIGLIVGGVLVGRDLIVAATIRAQVSQIEQLNQAVNTFRGKYEALPGDIRSETATRFGIGNTGTYCNGSEAGARDGNGLLHGNGTFLLSQGGGETQLFWQDITSPAVGSLIAGQYPRNGGSYAVCGPSMYSIPMSQTSVDQYLPAAAMGNGNYLYVYENQGSNWYGMSVVTSVIPSGRLFSNVGLTVAQAYNLDRKTDDGIPTTGNIRASYLNVDTSVVALPTTTATNGGTATSCYDTTSNSYSMTQNNGRGMNCALSFKFQ